MAADSQCKWPKEAYTAGNAGVMLVGHSAQHCNAPVALFGGRFYTGKQMYMYTDFGGGVDRKQGETPQEGAFREFAEELFAQDEVEAKATASKLCKAIAPALVGGRPFVYKNTYVMFVVPAEAVVAALQLPGVDEGTSAIDLVFASAKRNSELTSVSLVSLEEVLRSTWDTNGLVYPLSVRQLDGEERTTDEIRLRGVLVGTAGSIMTVTDALESFMEEPRQKVQQSSSLESGVDLRKDDGEHGSDVTSQLEAAPRQQGSSVQAGPPAYLEAPVVDGGKSRKGRWGRGKARPDSAASSSKPSAPAPAEPAVQVPPSRPGQQPAPYVFDMETGDPDDVLTLLFLCSHPAVDLRAVTITPGSAEQVALVRWLLQQMGQTHVRLGAQDWPANAKKQVDLSTLFYRSFGRSPDGEPRCERADQVLLECCDTSTTLLTGAPLHNLGDALEMDGFRLGRWVAQGGFAGEGVVPRDMQMDKFKGKYVCPTWNFGNSIPATEAALASEAIDRKICVSKNVCHSVYYDSEWHKALGAAAKAEAQHAPKARRALAFGMMHKTMEAYLRHKPGGKKLHDPLALAVALDECVCELAEVELFCRGGHWGSRLSPCSGTWISVAYDASKFEAVLLH